MSQWWEWPTMNASTVPFAATLEGGQLKALGNPAVWWGVSAVVVLVTPVWLLVAFRGAGRWANRERVVRALDPLIIPFATLYLGYMLNLVPYQLITRSKFVYHYIPALMVGVLLFATSMEGFLRTAKLHGGWSHRGGLLIAIVLFLIVSYAFVYWGIPFAYGYKLSVRALQARLWNKKW